MEIAVQLRREISRQFSAGASSVFLRRNDSTSSKDSSLRRHNSLDRTTQVVLPPSDHDQEAGRPNRRRGRTKFSFGRQSSLDPNRRARGDQEDHDATTQADQIAAAAALITKDPLTVPENLDLTMQLLFMACNGDVEGVEELLNQGVDVNSIDLDGRTALHIAACEGRIHVVKLLLTRRANIDARDRWGSTAAIDAKHYGNMEVYNILKSRGAKVPRTRKTPMVVSDPKEVPEYELDPKELHVRRGQDILKGAYQIAKWNGTKVAVKVLDTKSYRDLESINAFRQELMLLEKVRHPNVVLFVGAVTQNIPMMIISEYYSKGDLGSYLENKGRLHPSKVLRFALDIARGMNYLHECKPEPIIHCNLKPKNIFLDKGGHLKVAGFGQMKLSRISPDKAKLAHPESLRDALSVYTAPEIYRDEIFDRSVDSFSFGLILYEVLEGAPPFYPKAPEEVSKMIAVEGKRPEFKLKSKNYPPDLRELIEECWDPEPMTRPTFSEIIVRLDRICANGLKQGWWKETFRLPWNSK